MTADEAEQVLEQLRPLIADRERELKALKARRNEAVRVLAPRIEWSERALGKLAGITGTRVRQVRAHGR